jgi:peptidyl-prolyl cis-trans isomerase SurA
VMVYADNIVDEIVARVDNAIITRSDYVKAEQAGQAELQQQFPGNWQSKWAEHQKETLRGLIDQQLLLEKGKELGITGGHPGGQAVRRDAPENGPEEHG